MYIIANFKLNFSKKDFEEYFEEFKSGFSNLNLKDSTKIVFCPSFPYLSLVENLVSDLSNVYVGSQDVSVFNEGSHTSEVSALQIKDFCDYSIVGHSETRETRNLSNDQVNKKIINALDNNLTPVICISKKEELASLTSDISFKDNLVAYEPLEHIGSGSAASNDNIENFYESLGINSRILYGGSVNYENVDKLLELDFINGFLIGSASLDVEEFSGLVEKANQRL